MFGKSNAKSSRPGSPAPRVRASPSFRSPYWRKCAWRRHLQQPWGCLGGSCSGCSPQAGDQRIARGPGRGSFEAVARNKPVSGFDETRCSRRGSLRRRRCRYGSAGPARDPESHARRNNLRRRRSALCMPHVCGGGSGMPWPRPGSGRCYATCSSRERGRRSSTKPALERAEGGNPPKTMPRTTGCTQVSRSDDDDDDVPSGGNAAASSMSAASNCYIFPAGAHDARKSLARTVRQSRPRLARKGTSRRLSCANLPSY